MSYKSKYDLPMYVGQIHRNFDTAPTKAFVIQHLTKTIDSPIIAIQGCMIYLTTRKMLKPEDVSLRFVKSNSDAPHSPPHYYYDPTKKLNTLIEDFPYCTSCHVMLPHRTTMKQCEDAMRKEQMDPNSVFEQNIPRKELRRTSFKYDRE